MKAIWESPFEISFMMGSLSDKLMEFMLKEVICRMMFELWICIYLKVLPHVDLIDIHEGYMGKSF